MVAADFALLSLAVLSAIGFETAQGQRFGRHGRGLQQRAEDNTVYQTLITTTESTTSIPVLLSSPTPPGRGPSKVVVEEPTPSLPTSLDFGHAAPSQDGGIASPTISSSSDAIIPTSDGSSSDTSVTYNTLQVATDAVTSAPAVTATNKPPGRPGKVQTSSADIASGPSSLNMGHGTTVSEAVASTAAETLSPDASTTYNTPQEASESVTSIPVAATTPAGPPGRPGKGTSTTQLADVPPATDVPPVTSLNFGHPEPSSETSSADVSVSYQSLDEASESVTSVPAVATMPAGPPGRPGKGASTTPLADVLPATDVPPATSLNFGHHEPTSESLDADSTVSHQTLDGATESVTSVTSIPAAATTNKPPGRPGKVETSSSVTEPVPVSPSQAFSLNFGHGDETTDVPLPATSLTLNTLDQLDSVTSFATVAATNKPPTRPGKTTSTEAAEPPSATPDQSGSISASSAGVQLTYSQESSSSSSSSTTEYIYPGGYGAGGTLTTDSNAPSRTVQPSRGSVVPNSSTRIGPPPADTSPVFASSSTKIGPPPADTSTFATSTSTDMVVDPASSTTTTSSDSTASSDTSSAISSSSDDLSYLPGSVVGTGTRTDAGSTQSTTLPTHDTTTDFSTSNTYTLNFGHSTVSEDSATTTPPPTFNSTSTPGYNNGSYWGNMTTFTPYSPTASPSTWSFTVGNSYTTDSRGSTITYCDPTDAWKPTTTYSVVYTETITWYGNPADYTPPYAPISTPESCEIPKTPIRLTLSYCTATGTATQYITCDATTATLIYTTAAPGYSGTAPTITFVTTDKNPTVVYSTIETPDYGVSQPPKTDVQHASATPGDKGGNTPPNYISYQTPQRTTGKGAVVPVVLNPTPTVTPIPITVRPTAIIISSTTITDNPTAPTQTITVGGETWTVNPSQVVGAGQTVTRPTATGGVFVPVPTSTTVGGVAVTVSSSVAVIGGTSFTLGPTAITTVVGGQSVTAGPGGVVVGTATIPVVTVPSPTQVVVEGGGLITAIGSSIVVIHGTTITYGPGVTFGGPGTSVSTTVVDGDTITIGPSGVTVHGTTLGGPTAGGSSTQYEIVGGATITQIGPSVVVIGGATYTVGPGTGTTTTVLGGNTITIPPHNDPITTVVGGSTVTLPPSTNPSTTVVNGATITIPPHSEPITTVIGGQTIIVPPSTATATTVIDGQTITIPPHSTPLTSVIGGQTITIPPSTGAKTTIVGGQTITIPPHTGTLTTVIGGSTLTLPPGSGTTTTVIGGETITIGPGGVTASTYTIGYPFGPTTTVTVTPKATRTGGASATDVGVAEPTASEDAGNPMMGRPGWSWICIAFGVVFVV